jgi:hypothetical protein
MAGDRPAQGAIKSIRADLRRQGFTGSRAAAAQQRQEHRYGAGRFG